MKRNIQRGGVNLLILIIVVFLALLASLYLPINFKTSPSMQSNSSGTCGVKTTDALSYTAPQEEIIPVDITDFEYHHKYIDENASNLSLLGNTTYKHIRTKVPVFSEQLQTDPNESNLEHHFIPWGSPMKLQDGKTYKFYYPNWATDVFFGPQHTGRQILIDFGFMIGIPLDQNGQPQIVSDDSGGQYQVADVFQDIHNPDPMPEKIFTQEKFPDTAHSKGCEPIGNATATTQTIVTPTGSVESDKKELQLKTFSVEEGKIDHVWNVDCKPAIYLYPNTPTMVHIGVGVQGLLTYTTPLYDPVHGWNVTAYPNGMILDELRPYPYLYYEAKISDSSFQVPTTGYVEKKESLPMLFRRILPELGLSPTQVDDFTAYWMKALSSSPYYFVGVMKSSDIDRMEPLTITPSPATIIRVRLYFKALEKPITVSEPTLVTPEKKSGFTVVEWGGMVKRDATHPFTCSQ